MCAELGDIILVESILILLLLTQAFMFTLYYIVTERNTVRSGQDNNDNYL